MASGRRNKCQTRGLLSEEFCSASGEPDIYATLRSRNNTGKKRDGVRASVLARTAMASFLGRDVARLVPNPTLLTVIGRNRCK